MKNNFLIGLSVLLLSLSSHAFALTGWGAETGASTAGTCPSFCTAPWNFDIDGGEGFNASYSSLNNADGTSEASASLAGSTYLPVLRARGYSNAGTGAWSTAYGIQGYTFSGASSQNITLSLDLTGSAGGPDSYVRSDVAVILGSNLEYYADFDTLMSEIFLGNPGFSVFGTSSPSIQNAVNATVSDSIAFTLNPGDVFYVWAGLYAGGVRTGYGDAFNTLTMSFDNDAFLQVASVPEPSTYLLFGIGLLGLLFVNRRKLTWGNRA